ncbi:uncharacterized protein LOC110720756 [Chenopodium quinoa]|uniref:uncharacterized protein LOC110720756 n=1 Tax=Chenopodium quinoa TaxID=63459 RepID=UPI000B772C6D|nr:uncharacterized protein LOC110720756 [Chenopodium quinoa]
MVDIYKHMKHLRLAINKLENPTLINIPEMAKPFNAIFSGMSKEKWVEEFCSFMREVVAMQDELKDLKERVHCIDLSNPDTTLFKVDQPKDIITLLTIWYWLAAWSSPDQPDNHIAKEEFMEAIEAHDQVLGLLLVNTAPINVAEEQELKDLFCKLLRMLKSDHLLWTDVLNQFTNKMYSTGSMQLNSFKNADNTPSVCIGLPAAIATAVAVDVIVKVGKAAYENRDEIKNKLEDIGEDVVEFVSNAANEIEAGSVKVYNAVKDTAVAIGDGLQSMAQDAAKDLEKFGDNVKKELEKFGDQFMNGLGKFKFW